MRRILFSVLIACGLVCGGMTAPRATLGKGAPAAISVYLQWLSVDAHHPNMLFVGGQLGCLDPTVDRPCPSWAMRSTDGGATWADLSKPLGTDAAFGVYTIAAPTIAPDGKHLFIDTSYDGGSPASMSHGIMRSRDGGLHWAQIGEYGTYGGGYGSLSISPLVSSRLYAVSDAGNGGGSEIVFSDDAGTTWHSGGDPSGLAGSAYPAQYGPYGGLVADPHRLNTVYANVVSLEDSTPAYAARSDDKGVHWTMVMTPTVTPALRTFSVYSDPHLGTLLAGKSADAGVPADRRWFSGDGGKTWSASACPGDAAGVCPAFSVDNVFGNGFAYGFMRDGIYPFHGAGAAGGRLPISKSLPVRTAAIIDIGAGTHAGDPVYLLAQGVRGNVHGLLYRSVDRGKSWQALSAGVLPNLAPASKAPAALYVPQAKHSVAQPFVATYKSMSLLILGQPVTEAYMEGDALTQDFDHLRLELRGGKVVVGALGSDVYLYQRHEGAEDAPSVPNTPTRRYFPSTHHALQGDMLRFWQTHGGMAVFGAPITEIVKESNGDGSGRVYEMQWFQNARLERHPETHNPRYAILLGLLGPESLKGRWWAP